MRKHFYGEINQARDKVSSWWPLVSGAHRITGAHRCVYLIAEKPVAIQVRNNIRNAMLETRLESI